ncbi:MAG: acetyl-CoA carboxylase biotin carboxyl carrier protein [Thermoguttaceae bacterium]|jgi:acetyl-CoA carboxylase biotin carboxyl carrier protein
MVTPASSSDIFDVRKIRRLVELMKEHDLTEIDIQQGEVRIQLRRAGSASNPGVILPGPGIHGNAFPPAPGGPSLSRPAAETLEEPASDNHLAIIKSPMVGTFYAAPDPDSPPFVKVGDHVGPETTICIVEAMKVFNQIPAEVSGKIITVLAENGQSVEFGQPLFKVDTRT